MSIYDYSVEKPNGEMFNLSDCKGKVMLIVNTATGCGFTPHYEPLEAMYEKYHEAGLEIIDIPCKLKFTDVGNISTQCLQKSCLPLPYFLNRYFPFP